MTAVRTTPVIASPGKSVLFITLGITDNPESYAKVIEFAACFSALQHSMQNHFYGENFNALIGIGSEVWDKLRRGKLKPRELAPCKSIQSPKHIEVASSGDLFFHIRADRQDICFELAAMINQLLGEATYFLDEVSGFRYLDGRAIIGFVDGTENPEECDNTKYALIGDEDPLFRNGTYAFTQKYLHNMQARYQLPVGEQENVIGRHRFNDIELSDEKKPSTAHNNFSKVYDNNSNEMKIIRTNVAFSQASRIEYGTFFIGYSRFFAVIHQMLKQMFNGNADGYTDRRWTSVHQSQALYFLCLRLIFWMNLSLDRPINILYKYHRDSLFLRSHK